MDGNAYQAIDVFEALLSRQPHCARAQLELGLLYLRLGAIPKGRQHLQQALASRPTLEQRRLIESVLREQARLDRQRVYRPDFEALHREHRPSLQWVGNVWARLARFWKRSGRA